MKIKNSLAISQVLLLAGFAAVLLYFGYDFWLNDYVVKEQGESHEKITRISAAFEQERNMLLALANDWGLWDDAYAFVGGEKPEFANQYGQSNALSLSKVGVDFVSMYDKNGNNVLLAFAGGDGSELSKHRQLLENIFLKNETLRQFAEKSDGSAFTTIVYLENLPVLITVNKILPNSGKGEFRGRVMFGKIVNAQFLAQLLKKAYVNDVQLEFSDAPTEWQRFKVAENNIPTKYIADTVSENESGYLVISTLGTKPVFIKTIVKTAGDARHKLVMFALVLVLCVLIVVLLHLVVARRVLFNKFNVIAEFLKRFNVSQLRSSSSRLELNGDDELDEMAKAFNQTIDEVGGLYRSLALELEERKRTEQRLNEAQIGTIYSLARLAECRDTDTGIHLTRISRACKLIAGMARLHPEYSALIDDKFVAAIEVAATLHDIGKVGVSDSVLNKQSDLTPEEFESMKMHTVFGRLALKEMSEQYPENEFLKMACEIAYCHHEKWNGHGYPQGLSGIEIPLSARITAIADVFDALVSRRCYKPGFGLEKSRGIIVDLAGEQFDPVLVEVFIECYAEIAKEYENICEPDAG